jgi:hypothetical protein
MSSGDTKLKTLTIANGIDRNMTSYQAQGKWVDADKIRFHKGNPEKLGGWSRLVGGTTNYRGVARESLTWAALDGDKFYSVGTHKGLFLYNAGQWYDITPIRATATETSAINTFASNTTRVKVSDAGHQAVAGDYVVFTSVSDAQIDIHGVMEIVSANANNYVVSVNGNCSLPNSTAQTKKGGSVTFSYLLQTGKVDNEPTTGYGSGTYGSGVYGTGTTGSLITNMRLWDFDTWGEDLLALQRGGLIYRWDKSDGTGVRASVAHVDIPTRADSMIISEEARHMILFGTSAFGGDYDPLVWRFSQSENYAIWSPAVTNAAGGGRLNSGSYTVGAVKSKKEIVVFTDDGAHSIVYRGAPFYFSQERLGVACGLIGPNAAIDVNGIVYWMGKRSFFKYDGQVQNMDCTIHKTIFEPESNYSINYDQKEKIYVGVNSEFNEIWWFYPSINSTENDRYVIYNYVEGTWADGAIGRTTWADSNLFDYPIATGTSEAAYSHEVGHNADGAEMPAYLESGYFDIEEGQVLTFVDKLIPDITELEGNYMSAYIKLKKHPSETAKVKGPYVIGPTTKKVSLRGRARQISLRVEVSGVDSNFRMGNWRGAISPDGER